MNTKQKPLIVRANTYQRKSFTIDVKELSVDETARKVSGYLAIFGNKDSDSDILIKGCFAKSITERGPASATNRKIAFLFQHDMKDPIGRFTLLKEDDIGLYFEAILDEGVESADRTLIQLKSGTLNQFSIGYQYVWDRIEYDEQLDAFIVKEVNLFEGSVVTLGANEMTFFDGMKSEDKEKAHKDLIAETETFINSIPNKYKLELRQLIAKHNECTLAFSKSKEDLKTKDSSDMNIAFIDDITDHYDQANQIIDGCMDDLDNEDLMDKCDEMKSFHQDMTDKMMDIKTSITEAKTLNNRKPTAKKQKSPSVVEPEVHPDTIETLKNFKLF